MNRRSISCMLATSIMAACLFSTRAVANDVARNNIFSALSESLDVRATNNNEKIIVTRRTSERALKVGLEGVGVLLASETNSFSIRGWTIVHLPEEDPRALVERFEKNLALWIPMIEGKTSGHMPVKVESSGGDIRNSLLGVLVPKVCRAQVGFDVKRPVYFTLIDAKGAPARDFCVDYMLVLAANDIVLSSDAGRLVAKLDSVE